MNGQWSLHFAHSLTGQRDERAREMRRDIACQALPSVPMSDRLWAFLEKTSKRQSHALLFVLCIGIDYSNIPFCVQFLQFLRTWASLSASFPEKFINVKGKGVSTLSDFTVAKQCGQELLFSRRWNAKQIKLFNANAVILILRNSNV